MTYQSTITADSPTSYWRLGEATPGTGTAVDVQGAHNGTYVASPVSTTGALSGDANTAVDFTGAEPRYVTTSWTTIPAPPLSIEAWFNVAVFTDECVAGWWASGSLAFMVRLGGPNDILFSAGATVVDVVDAAYENSGWHHLVCTHDGTYSRVYVDGSLVGGPTSAAFSGGASTYPFLIGNYGNNYTANFAGKIDEVAVYPSALSLAQVQAHYAAGTVSGPTWTTPADTVSMSTTPELKFDSPASAVAQHFYLELDTANTFNTGSLRAYDSSTSQTNWDYWNGSAWTALPSTGLASTYAGNEIRYTVTSALSSATWYRRVRAGTLS